MHCPVSFCRMGVSCCQEDSMNTAEVDAYLRANPGAEKDFKAECGWWR